MVLDNLALFCRHKPISSGLMETATTKTSTPCARDTQRHITTVTLLLYNKYNQQKTMPSIVTIKN